MERARGVRSKSAGVRETRKRVRVRGRKKLQGHAGVRERAGQVDEGRLHAG